MKIVPTCDTSYIKLFINSYHPPGVSGSLRGMMIALWGYERDDAPMPAFLAVIVYPRSRWTRHNVRYELSRLVIAPYAERSASTFLRAM